MPRLPAPPRGDLQPTHPSCLVAVDPGADRFRPPRLQEPVPGDVAQALAAGHLQQGRGPLTDVRLGRAPAGLRQGGALLRIKDEPHRRWHG